MTPNPDWIIFRKGCAQSYRDLDETDAADKLEAQTYDLVDLISNEDPVGLLIQEVELGQDSGTLSPAGVAILKAIQGDDKSRAQLKTFDFDMDELLANFT